jgi:hypothetical protein
MCVNYTDINKHCPKDPSGLPRIDQIIDSTTGCDPLYFLDYYSGYHQIAIMEEDQEKTAFTTPFSTYCYTTISFGLEEHWRYLPESYPGLLELAAQQVHRCG